MRWALTVSGKPELGVLVFTLSSALSQPGPSKSVPNSPFPLFLLQLISSTSYVPGTMPAPREAMWSKIDTGNI